MYKFIKYLILIIITTFSLSAYASEVKVTATGKIKKAELKKSFENYYINHHKGSDES